MLGREIFFFFGNNETEYIIKTRGQNTKSLGAFAELRKASIKFVMSVSLSIRLSIHVERFGSHWTDFYEILYLSISANLSRKLKIH